MRWLVTSDRVQSILKRTVSIFSFIGLLRRLFGPPNFDRTRLRNRRFLLILAINLGHVVYQNVGDGEVLHPLSWFSCRGR